MRLLQTCILSCLIFLVPTSAFGTLFTIETEAGPSWRAIGPQDTLAFQNANPGWNNSVGYDDSDAAGWSAGDFIRVYHEGDGEEMIWASNRNIVAYFRHVFTLDGPVMTATLNGVIDDDGQIYINGTLVYEDINGAWTDFSNVDISPYLTAGDNLIAVKAWNVMLQEAIGLHMVVETVPEPTTLSLLTLGGLSLLRRRGTALRRSEK